MNATDKATPSNLLTVGCVINQRWRVVAKIGGGGFGEVYEACDARTDERTDTRTPDVRIDAPAPLRRRANVAIKVERQDHNKHMLRIEATVLRILQRQQHVCRFLGCGAVDGLNYLVMSLHGANLQELRRRVPSQRFTLPTALRLTLQIFDALAIIHAAGFLHRDVKPSNFAIGCRASDARVVYMLDYGLARQYTTSEGRLRPPRASASFRGTVRYAAVSTHRGREIGRHDDLWSLFYMLIEFVKGRLPWSGVKERAEVCRLKEQLRYDAVLRKLPVEFSVFVDELKRLTYFDAPDYGLLRECIVSAMRHHGVKRDEPFDWEVESGSESGKQYIKKLRKSSVFQDGFLNSISRSLLSISRKYSGKDRKRNLQEDSHKSCALSRGQKLQLWPKSEYIHQNHAIQPIIMSNKSKQEHAGDVKSEKIAGCRKEKVYHYGFRQSKRKAAVQHISGANYDLTSLPLHCPRRSKHNDLKAESTINHMHATFANFRDRLARREQTGQEAISLHIGKPIYKRTHITTTGELRDETVAAVNTVDATKFIVDQDGKMIADLTNEQKYVPNEAADIVARTEGGDEHAQLKEGDNIEVINDHRQVVTDNTFCSSCFTKSVVGDNSSSDLTCSLSPPMASDVEEEVGEAVAMHSSNESEKVSNKSGPNIYPTICSEHLSSRNECSLAGVAHLLDSGGVEDTSLSQATRSGGTRRWSGLSDGENEGQYGDKSNRCEDVSYDKRLKKEQKRQLNERLLQSVGLVPHVRKSITLDVGRKNPLAYIDEYYRKQASRPVLPRSFKWPTTLHESLGEKTYRYNLQGCSMQTYLDNNPPKR